MNYASAADLLDTFEHWEGRRIRPDITGLEEGWQYYLAELVACVFGAREQAFPIAWRAL